MINRPVSFLNRFARFISVLLTVLDRDLMTIDASEIPKVQVLETWLDGQRVWHKVD